MPFCNHCGSSNMDSSRFCGNCGSSVALEVPTQSAGWPQQLPGRAVSVPALQSFVVPVVPAYVLVRPPKSVGVAILLTVFFGPLGMLYSTIPGALVMIVVSLILGLMTAGLSAFLTWPVCIIWGAMAADTYNKGRG